MDNVLSSALTEATMAAQSRLLEASLAAADEDEAEVDEDVTALEEVGAGAEDEERDEEDFVWSVLPSGSLTTPLDWSALLLVLPPSIATSLVGVISLGLSDAEASGWELESEMFGNAGNVVVHGSGGGVAIRSVFNLSPSRIKSSSL